MNDANNQLTNRLILTIQKFQEEKYELQQQLKQQQKKDQHQQLKLKQVLIY